MCNIIVSLLALLSIVVLVASETTSSTEASINHNPAQKCQKSLKRQAADEELKRCLNGTLTKYLDPTVQIPQGQALNPVCSNLNDFNTTLQAFRATYKSECGILLNNTETFLRTINNTLSDRKFKDFYDNRACFAKIEINLTACMKASMGHANASLSVLGIVSPNFDYSSRSCDKTEKLQKCVIPILNATCGKAVDFTSSAFENVLENCRKVAEANKERTKPATKPSIIIYVVASLAVIVGVIITVVFVKKIINNKKKAECSISYSAK